MQFENLKTMKDVEQYLLNNTLSDEEIIWILQNIKHTARFLDKHVSAFGLENIYKYGKISLEFIHNHPVSDLYVLGCFNSQASDAVIKKCLAMIDGSVLIDNFDALVPVIRKFPDMVDWYWISRYQKLSEGFIREFADYVDWVGISRYQNLSENFIREFADKVDWDEISACQKLSESFIREFADKVYWYWISISQKLSEDFIREFADKVKWNKISIYQKLSESFISEFADKVDWDRISEYQKLSESFIREFADKVDWDYISIYQKLSEDFIRKCDDRVNWYWVSKHQQLSENFMNEFKDKLDNNSISDSWHYKSTDFKKEQVMATGLYECHDDYFIAYKGIRSDRYSKYNFQYQYLSGRTYECFADHSDNENSFGLSIWDCNHAKEYCDELVVKCKVYYSDIARVVHNGGKIRCSKITVLD